jgi:hypothetical protein
MKPPKPRNTASAPSKPPPLLPYSDPDGLGPGLTQADFRALFDYIYVAGHWYAEVPGQLPLKVRFLSRHFDHAFFKEPAEGEPRTVWQPQRAERILWIGHTLENPTEVYQDGASSYRFLCRMGDSAAPWCRVIVVKTGDGAANFVTVYTLSHDDARERGKGAVRLWARK